ncbi:MAG: amidohydrolase [Proteobacteria bacterium]|nr:amidohydrolase [Pseudomonadota bacterium]
MAQRHLVISADCHAAAPWPDYEPYFEKRHRSPFRDWYGARVERRPVRPGERLFDEKFLDQMDEAQEVERGGRRGAWDPEKRIAELDADGVAAEVIFPAAESFHVPFHGYRPTTGRLDPQPRELRAAGARAYNRWLADLCSHNPQRCAGVVMVDYADVDAAVEEIRRASREGLRGGVLLPAEWDDLPSYNHPRYQPVWSACEELGLPVNTHPLGSGREAYGDLPGATPIFLSEVKWFAHRPFTFLLWAGVFERHPRLRFVLTEQMADWIPETLTYFDDLYERPIFAQIRQGLPLKPSEYWRRQCYVGASFLQAREFEMRHAIGLDKIMWGSDYPHAEGTWPHTREKLRETFGGCPEAEVGQVVGGNAARVYDFDLEALAPLAARIGPEVSALA